MSAAIEAANGGGKTNGAVQQQQQQQVHQVTDAMLYMHNGIAYHLPAGDGNAADLAAATAESTKRKRGPGRPRKYNVDVPMPLEMVLPSTPPAAVAPDGGSSGTSTPTLPPGFGLNLNMEPAAGAMASDHLQAPPPLASQASHHAKKRGRPPGSSNKVKLQQKPKHKQQPPPPPQQQQQPLMAAPGLMGVNPHIFTVQAGEDVTSRAMSFSCNGWAVCILSANGTVSSVTLRQGGASGGTVTYEGHFEILSLSGSYLVSDCAGLSSRIGGLTVSLVGLDGRIFGGSIAGPLTAASPVQVVVGNFLSDGKKKTDLSLAPGTSSSPSSGGTLRRSCGGHGSAPITAGSLNINQPGFPNFPPWK